jgi:RHS repeat-associated protein
LNVCLAGSFVPVAPECFGPAASGSFTMHGLMVDVLADGKALLYARARHYDMKHGRWLQRDPLGFIDGPNLYEAFGGNPLVNVDPEGKGIITFLFAVGYAQSDWQFIKDTLWTAGGIAADMKYEFSRTTGYETGLGSERI